jgi:hypothetical protein
MDDEGETGTPAAVGPAPTEVTNQDAGFIKVVVFIVERFSEIRSAIKPIYPPGFFLEGIDNHKTDPPATIQASGA